MGKRVEDAIKLFSEKADIDSLLNEEERKRLKSLQSLMLTEKMKKIEKKITSKIKTETEKTKEVKNLIYLFMVMSAMNKTISEVLIDSWSNISERELLDWIAVFTRKYEDTLLASNLATEEVIKAAKGYEILPVAHHDVDSEIHEIYSSGLPAGLIFSTLLGEDDFVIGG